MYTGNMESAAPPGPASTSNPSTPSAMTAAIMLKAAAPRWKERFQTESPAVSVIHIWAMLHASTASIPMRTYSHAGFHQERSDQSITLNARTPGDETSATPQ